MAGAMYIMFRSSSRFGTNTSMVIVSSGTANVNTAVYT